MGRTPRRESATGYYHVVTRGNRRQAVFHTPEDYQQYLRLLAVASATYAVPVAHYCLMPNHIHILLRAATRTSVSQTLHQVQRRYWFAVHRRYGLTGHLWQGRFHSFPIEDESYLLECARYIERNPVEAGLVPQPGDYSWSSYPAYATSQAGLLPLISTPGYEALGATLATRQTAYQRFVETPQPYDRAMRRKLERVTAYA